MSGRGDRERELTLLQVVNSILRQRRHVVRVFMLLCGVGLLVLLLMPTRFSSAFSFVPQQAGGPVGIASLAAQFGVEIPAANASNSPDFYVDLLRSREILGTIVDGEYRRADGSEVTLSSLAEGLFAADSAVLRDRAIKELEQRTSATVSKKSGIVRVRVAAAEPLLAKQLADAFLGLVLEFDVEKRQMQSAAERRFSEGRVKAVGAELRAAEDRLEQFLRRNRDYQSAPELVFEHDRLSRGVANAQQLYSVLVQAHERARIEEVRETPVLTVIDSPAAPIRPDPRGRLLKFVAVLLASLIVASLTGIAVDYFRPTAGTSEDDITVFRDLSVEFRRELRDPRLLFTSARASK